MTNDFQLQEVRSNNHYCTSCKNYEIITFNNGHFKSYLRLDTSLFVHNEGPQQNKLAGFWEDHVHQNSARVSYHTISDSNDRYMDSLVLKTYVYNSGSRNIKENYKLLTLSWHQVESMTINGEHLEIDIKILDDKYQFQLNQNLPISVTRTSSLSTMFDMSLARHYYGGPDSIPAPHDMKLWIKYDEIMLK